MKARKQFRMYELFGKNEQHKCKECCNLLGGVNQYRKCRYYGVSASESTDWALSWNACGLFNRTDYKGIPVVKIQHWREPKQEEQIDGQLRLEGV